MARRSRNGATTRFGRVQSKTQSLHGRSLIASYSYAAGGKVNRIAYRQVES
jgi:hypothetical protein